MTPEQIRKSRCEAQRAADLAIEFIGECVEGDVRYFWEIIRDTALSHAPLSVEKKAELTAMSDSEADMFERRQMLYGKYDGQKIESVPLSYLDWLVRQQEEEDQFRMDLRRYLISWRLRGGEDDSKDSEE